MKKLLASIMLIVPMMAWGSYGVPHVERVVSIYDGDTFYADIEGWPPIIGKNIPIRVLGADTPEIRSRCDNEADKEYEKAWAIEVRDFVYDMLINTDHIDLHKVDRGTFFRVVADVHIDGVSLTQILIDKGMAVPEESGMTVWCGKRKDH